jgi:hypothetical protein
MCYVHQSGAVTHLFTMGMKTCLCRNVTVTVDTATFQVTLDDRTPAVLYPLSSPVHVESDFRDDPLTR